MLHIGVGPKGASSILNLPRLTGNSLSPLPRLACTFHSRDWQAILHLRDRPRIEGTSNNLDGLGAALGAGRRFCKPGTQSVF